MGKSRVVRRGQMKEYDESLREDMSKRMAESLMEYTTRYHRPLARRVDGMAEKAKDLDDEIELIRAETRRLRRVISWNSRSPWRKFVDWILRRRFVES